MITFKVLFWLSAFLIFYAYIGYPFILWVLSSFAAYKSKRYADVGLPKASLLISAYNEEDIIEEKILNSLSLNYPKALLEIIVVSDGSDDRTNTIAKKYEDQGLILKYFEGRIGKTACLNRVVPFTKGDIVVFSDANSKYDKDAVRNLVAPFVDNKIGFVSGYTKYFSREDDESSVPIGIYSKIEKITKKLESKIGSCVGADGAIFAIRKYLYKPLQDVDINDFVIPLNIIRQGFKGILEEKAFCVEKTAGNSKREFKRQMRITNRTIRAIFNNLDLLNPFKYGFFSFELLSHKISKFITPFFMLILFLSNLVLINDGLEYGLAFLGQSTFVMLAWLGYNDKGYKVLSKLSSMCCTFVIINLAILKGWFQFFRGKTHTTWSPVKR